MAEEKTRLAAGRRRGRLRAGIWHRRPGERRWRGESVLTASLDDAAMVARLAGAAADGRWVSVQAEAPGMPSGAVGGRAVRWEGEDAVGVRGFGRVIDAGRLDPRLVRIRIGR